MSVGGAVGIGRGCGVSGYGNWYRQGVCYILVCGASYWTTLATTS